MSILQVLDRRNLKVFKNEEHLVQFSKMLFSRNLFAWMKQYIKTDSVSFFFFG